VAVYLSELSEGSRRTMRFGLTTAAAFFGGGDPERFKWHRLRVQHLAALRADLAERLAPNTANKILAAVKGVLRASWRLGLMSAEDLYRCTDVRPVRGGPAHRGRALTKQELRLLFAACGDGPGGRRDAAALACLYGCRRSEPVALDLADYDPGSGRLRIRQAKGNKHRNAYLTNGAKRAMDDWLEVRGDEPGPLLVPVDAIGRVTMRRLRDQALYEICKRLARRAGIDRFSPHDLRRTFAGDMLDAGADVALVQRLMGHASVATTVGYDRRTEEATRRAAVLARLPYREKPTTIASLGGPWPVGSAVTRCGSDGVRPTRTVYCLRSPHEQEYT
jgi:integrase